MDWDRNGNVVSGIDFNFKVGGNPSLS